MTRNPWKTDQGSSGSSAGPASARQGEKHMIQPHGGKLVDRVLKGKAKEEALAKAPGLPKLTIDGNEIVAEIAPGAQDIVIYKQKPSGFFGTNMTSYLTLLGCDSVIVTGTTTSGCVRATVLDAFSLNYRITLAEEGCFDRSQASHAINLCDMNAKYADVVKTSEVLDERHRPASTLQRRWIPESRPHVPRSYESAAGARAGSAARGRRRPGARSPP